MSYRVQRSRKIVDKLELCDENGCVVKTLDIYVDIDAIAGELRKRLTNIITAEKQLKNARRENYAELLELYGQTVADVFCVCFGKENAEIITEHFEGNYIEMSAALTPYIYEVILPAVNTALTERKKSMRALYRNRK